MDNSSRDFKLCNIRLKGGLRLIRDNEIIATKTNVILEAITVHCKTMNLKQINESFLFFYLAVFVVFIFFSFS